MQLLRSVYSFGATNEEIVHLWTVFCRSVLEQACIVWHSSLTNENSEDLERTQKTFWKLILREKYKKYEDSLIHLNLDSLQQRRQNLCLQFAKSGIKHNNMTDLLPEESKLHNMQTRNTNKFKVNFANTGRLKDASIIHMQNLLNDDNEQQRKRNFGWNKLCPGEL